MIKKSYYQLPKSIINSFSFLIFIAFLASCNNDGAVRQNTGDKTIKIDNVEYLKRTNYGDEREVLDIEDKIIDKIFELPEVKERAAYIIKETKGERYLEIWIAARPDEDIPYYWIKAGEDNGMSLVTHFDFYVYPKTMTVKFYDVVENKVLSLAEWRRVSQ
jgi:hypothetical protein